MVGTEFKTSCPAIVEVADVDVAMKYGPVMTPVAVREPPPFEPQLMHVPPIAREPETRRLLEMVEVPVPVISTRPVTVPPDVAR